MKKTQRPYKVYHLDVTSAAARENQALQQAYMRMSSVFTKRHERVAAAKEIQTLGGYQLAAEVDAPTALDAILLTTNKGQGLWVDAGNKKVDATGLSARSTSPLDIISRFEEDEFLFMPLGMLSLKTGEFSESVE